MTLLRYVEHRLPAEDPCAMECKARMRAWQGAQQRRVVPLRTAGGEVAAGAGREACALGDAPDHIRFERHRRRRCARARDLRVEGADESVGTLRREGRRRIEEAEVTGMREVGQPVLEHSDRPVEELRERTRAREVEFLELAAEGLDIEGGRG